ncbi:MAG: indole-3-glycerol-phosphate synthase [Candidatus Diapherotrites archaeon]|nr:indole-3-glycerol-phosphate synthase [Candidatus Diapherotrites archaeon]
MDILDRFIAQAKQNLRDGYYENLPAPGKENKKSLQAVLQKNAFSLIAEIKHASPAGEYAFDSIDVEKTARVFRKAGADAISVVTEPRIFKGNLHHIPLAKKAGLPVLFKDFVLDERQIGAARICGADCILLIAQVLTRTGKKIQPLIDSAHQAGLEVLLECYAEDEIRHALKTDTDILGINNRNLQTLQVDLSHTTCILEKIPELDRPLISESGIQTAQDVARIRASGVQGALVGTTIWKAADIGKKVRELKGGKTNE